LSFRIGGPLGVPEKLPYMLIFGILLIALTLAAGYPPSEYPRLPSTTYGLIAVMGATVLFAFGPRVRPETAGLCVKAGDGS
jgi:hypothetical protein